MCTICNQIICQCFKNRWLKNSDEPDRYDLSGVYKPDLPLFPERQPLIIPVLKLEPPIKKFEKKMVKCPMCQGYRYTPMLDGSTYWCTYCNSNGMVEEWSSY